MSTDAPDFLDALAERDVSEVEADTLLRLDYIIHADMRTLWNAKTGKMLPVHQWPESVVLAIDRFNYSEKSQTWVVDFCDRAKALDVRARLSGLYAKKDDKDNPLEALLRDLSREDLRVMITGLKELRQAETDRESARSGNSTGS